MGISNSYKNTVLADSPIRYYRLDETSGTAATDIGSGAHNGTYTGGFTLNQTSLLKSDSDASATFNGTTGYVSIPTTGLPTGAGTWSVEAWVNFSSFANAPQVFFLGSNSSNQAIELYYSITNSRWQADLNGATTVNGSSASTNTTYYLAATYDGTQLRLYVNGSLAGGPTTVTANVTYGSALIGSFNASSEFPTGRIDEAAIYNAALSATQVTAHYNAGIAITKSTAIRSVIRTINTVSSKVRTVIRTLNTASTKVRTIVATKNTRSTSVRTRVRTQVTKSTSLRIVARGVTLTSRLRIVLRTLATKSTAIRARVSTKVTKSTALRAVIRGVTKLVQLRILVGSASAYKSAVLTDSPIRYYRLGESSGTSAADIGSQNQAGTYTGGFTLGSTSLIMGDMDPSAVFNGTTGYVSIPTTSLPSGASAWSVECWTLLTSLSNAPQLFYIGSNSSNQAIELYYSITNSRWQADLNGATVVGGGGAASINTVYHLVATYDGSNLRLYVNGSLVAGPTAVTANVTFGSAYIGSFNASSEFPTGLIDEPAIYSTALSATQVANHWNAGIHAPSYSQWSGIGMNYGHDVSDAVYSTSQVESDFTFLRSVGMTRIRIVMPEFDDSSTVIANCQDMVTRALNHGFYVIWGVVAGLGSGTLTATRWSSAKTYITGTLAPWAQSVGLSELVLTNESELSADGTTLTTSTIRSDIRSMASTVKTNGFTGKVSYNTDILSATRGPWASEGLGSLDYIGFNSYDILANFDARNDLSDFATGKAYISEFGSTGGGYPDFNNETLFYNDTVGRINSLKSWNVPSGYFFCYRDGQQGVTANTFALIQTNGVEHSAINAVLGTINVTKSTPIRTIVRTLRTAYTSLRAVIRTLKTVSAPIRTRVRTQNTKSAQVRSVVATRNTFSASLRTPVRTKVTKSTVLRTVVRSVTLVTQLRAVIRTLVTRSTTLRTVVRSLASRSTAIRTLVRTLRSLSIPLRAVVRTLVTKSAPLRAVVRSLATRSTQLRAVVRTTAAKSLVTRVPVRTRVTPSTSLRIVARGVTLVSQLRTLVRTLVSKSVVLRTIVRTLNTSSTPLRTVIRTLATRSLALRAVIATKITRSTQVRIVARTQVTKSTVVRLVAATKTTRSIALRIVARGITKVAQLRMVARTLSTRSTPVRVPVRTLASKSVRTRTVVSTKNAGTLVLRVVTTAASIVSVSLKLRAIVRTLVTRSTVIRSVVRTFSTASIKLRMVVRTLVSKSAPIRILVRSQVSRSTPVRIVARTLASRSVQTRVPVRTKVTRSVPLRAVMRGVTLVAQLRLVVRDTIRVVVLRLPVRTQQARSTVVRTPVRTLTSKSVVARLPVRTQHNLSLATRTVARTLQSRSTQLRTPVRTKATRTIMMRVITTQGTQRTPVVAIRVVVTTRPITPVPFNTTIPTGKFNLTIPSGKFNLIVP